MRLTDTHLLAWLAGALEPGDAAIVEAQVTSDPALRTRLVRLERALTPPTRAQNWRIPPPGIAGGRVQIPLTAHYAPVMGATQPRVGDRFRLKIDGTADPSLIVVVLRQKEDWEVVVPTSSLQLVRVGQLPAAEDGWWVDLVAPEPAGLQRWAIALVAESLLPTEWTNEPSWSSLSAAMAAGEVSVTSVEVEVLPR